MIDKFGADLETVANEASLPKAPLVMPKQELEFHFNWVFSIYARFMHRA